MLGHAINLKHRPTHNKSVGVQISRSLPLSRKVVCSVSEVTRSTNAQSTNPNVEAVALDILEKIKYGFGKTAQVDEIEIDDLYRGAAWSLREALLDRFYKTQKYFKEKDPKHVYYLSAEFLMGRTLTNALQCLSMDKEYSDALKKLGASLEAIEQEEPDAALGNGGLGRLAACFLDSMATLDLPACGYGIRYRFGLFKQGLVDNYQAEYPDEWLQHGNPWEVRRNDIVYEVGFGGVAVGEEEQELFESGAELPIEKEPLESDDEPSKDKKEGKEAKETKETKPKIKIDYRAPREWITDVGVFAQAVDVPIPGYETLNCANLRLWDALAEEEIDLEAFNDGRFDEAYEAKKTADKITAVLYPNDSTPEGKALRLQQQYFFVSASLQDVLYRFKQTSSNWNELASKAIFQLNDTHPAIAVPELMRILVDSEQVPWDEAWKITKECLAYTNHTVLPEALEKWPVEVIQKYLPRHMEIIREIDAGWKEEAAAFWKGKGLTEKEVKAKVDGMSIIHPNQWNKKEILVNMAYLSVVGCKAVNGVAAIHSEIIKKDIFPDFVAMFPEKFQNKTNGVTPRRWLAFCNPPLADLITETVGSDDWINQPMLLKKLNDKADDPAFQQKWRDIKVQNKQKLADLIQEIYDEPVNINAMFDVHIKRIHEYKRQLMNVLSIMWRYKQLKKMSPEERAKTVPRVCVIGGKAASAYDMAKRIIHLCAAVGDKINADPETNEYLKLFYLPNYNVSVAEVAIPGTELSQHISTAGTEASGTSNMKFAMNGALIIGTMDGANIEIADCVGKENLFTFGVDAADINQLRKERKDFKTDPRWDELMRDITKGRFCTDSDNKEELKEYQKLVDSVHNMDKGNDWFLVANDFAAYLDAQEEADKVYKDQTEWTRRSILYCANSGQFSSDRTIKQYAEEIWGVEPTPVPGDQA